MTCLVSWMAFGDSLGGLYRFLKGTAEVVDFVMLVAYLSVRSDEVSKIAMEALAETGPEEDKTKWRKKLGPTWIRDRRSRFGRLMFELQITRAVDHCFAYVADLLPAVFLPALRRCGRAIKSMWSFVLRHETMEDLVSALAERRVGRLA